MLDSSIIAAAARKLFASAASPATVILFGSYATGEPGPDSDLDFLVIEDEVESKLDEMVRLRDALADLDVPVDILVTSREELERKHRWLGSVLRHAVTEGRVLVEP